MRIYFAGDIRGGRQDAALYYEIVRQLRKHSEVLTGQKTTAHFRRWFRAAAQ
jgi:hypothetical protein